MLFYFYFISFAKKKKQTTKNKQTNRKNVGKDTATAVANYIGPVIVKGGTVCSLILINIDSKGTVASVRITEMSRKYS